MDKIQDTLFSLGDSGYRDFHSSLMPSVDKSLVIGVRTPHLRKYAKKIKDSTEARHFISQLPHRYYEENNLHSFLLCLMDDFDACVDALKEFLPYIDNWATCDSLKPKCFKKGDKRLLELAEYCLSSGHLYTQRYGIGIFMTYFLDEGFEVSQLERVASIESDEYYLNMMSAWYFATALAKRWEDTIEFITEKKLPVWVHNKTIQKAVESLRISEEQKIFLKGFKIKGYYEKE